MPPGPAHIHTLAASLVALAATASAHAEAPERQAQPTLIAEHTAVTPGGTVRVAVDFAINPGWHLYWPGRNDTGFEPQVEWELPDGWTVGDLHWPAPIRYVSPGDILDHIYEDHLTLIAELTAPTAAAGTAEIAAELSWLVCKDVCIPEDARVSLTLPVSQSSRPTAHAPAFAAAQARWPTPADPSVLAYGWNDTTLTLSTRGGTRVEFYPHADTPDILAPISSLASDGSALRITFTRDFGPIDRASGILAITHGDITRWLTIELPGPDAAIDAPVDTPTSDSATGR